MTHHIFVRADASIQIGTGHLMRCLALAQALREQGGDATFITTCNSSKLLKRLTKEGFRVVTLSASHSDAEDWTRTNNILKATDNAYVVLDGYHFDSGYQQRVKAAGYKLMLIDDMAHLEHYYADVILNQNIGSDALQYSCEPYTRFLMGTHYCLLRKEFRCLPSPSREITKIANKLIVTMGGSDSNNVTLKVVLALQALENLVEGLEAVVIVGPSNPNLSKLQSVLKQQRSKIRLISNPADMPTLMSWADIAISGGGSTIWELAYMGLPTLTIVLAENQHSILKQLGKEKKVVNLGWHTELHTDDIVRSVTKLIFSPETRSLMSKIGQEMVDGQGANRVLSSFLDRELRLITATMEHSELMWLWANDQDVRSSSFSPDQIPFEEHVRWLRRKLADPNCFIFVAIDEYDAPVGQVRFDLTGAGIAEIDVSIDRAKRSLGYGRCLISASVAKLFKATSVSVVHALIKPNNSSSIRAFEKAGFTKVASANVKGQAAVQYSRAQGNG